MIKDGFNLDKYFVAHDKDGTPYAVELSTDKKVPGMNGFTITNLELKYGGNQNKRKVDYDAYHFDKIGKYSASIVLNNLKDGDNELASLGLLDQLENDAKFYGKQKSNGVEFYPRLYQESATITDIREKYHIGSKTILRLFKILRHYGLAIIHYGHIIFSPCLYYTASISQYYNSLNYYIKLLSQDKYGRNYLKNIKKYGNTRMK